MAKRGRPAAGKQQGEMVRDYPRVGLRLPTPTLARLKAWSSVTQRPIWALIDQAIEEAIERAPDAERKLVQGLALAQAKALRKKGAP